MYRTITTIALLALLFAPACNTESYTDETGQPMSGDWEPAFGEQESTYGEQASTYGDQEAMNPMYVDNQASSPSRSGKRVAILDQGFRMTRGTQVIPDGWTLNQDIATDPNTAQIARFHLEIRGPGGELIKALGMAQYGQHLGTGFEQAIQRMTMQGLANEMQDVSIGNLQRSATLEQAPQFQKAMAYGASRGMQVQGLEAPIKGSRNGNPVSGILYLGHFSSQSLPGMGTIQGSVITASPDGLENAVRINNEISHSYQANPQFEQSLQQAHAGTMQRQNTQHQQMMANSRAQHQQRMASNQAAFNAHQQRMQSQSQASDQQHARWMEGFRNSGSSAWSTPSYTGHDAYIDGIHERSTFQDPYSGQQVSQDGQYDNWYNNGLGEYYGTDDPSFDPNSMDGNWERIEPLRPNP